MSGSAKKDEVPFGSIKQRNGKHRARWYEGGRQHSRSFPTYDDADDFLRRKYADVEKRRKLRDIAPELVPDDDAPVAMTLSALIELFKDELLNEEFNEEQQELAPATRRSYRESLEMFTAFFVKRQGDPRISTIRRKHVKAFVRWRRLHPRPVGKRTVQKDVAVLSRVFEYAVEEELLEANPVRVKLGKVLKRKPVILKDQELDLLVAACPDETARVYVRLLAESGLRAESEALWLRREDIDLQSGFIEVGNGHRVKSETSRRSVPITPRLREVLVPYLGRTGPSSPWLFCHETNRRHHHAGDRIKSLRRAVKAAARLAGLLREWHVHDLRHRRVTTWLAEGQPLAIVQEALGHSDPRVTDGYKHLAKEHLKVLAGGPKVAG
jgi:integrase/recombinase XerD